ncbi:MAG: hypothetical protein ABI356_07180 [Steroidobacteraceae bacterium]
MITESMLWFFAALGAFMVGVSKAGIIGVLLGALAGRWLLKHVNQNLFEQLVLLLSAIGRILLIL